MNIKLMDITIENFKGIDRFSFMPKGSNAVIKAENGVGKTSVYDSFLWLLFGKDSTGRKDFEVRPLDRHNQPIKGVVVSVEAALQIDGVTHVFKKEHHEHVVKNQLRGYETLCWIDDVPKKISEYQDYITDLIPEETFKLLTDLNYFNSKLHWTERRKVLLDIAGEISIPSGYEDLTESLNGRTVDEYKKVLQEQKKRYEKERDEINPRIDEILKGLEHPADIYIKDLTNKRLNLDWQVMQLKLDRQELINYENLQKRIQEKINKLESAKIKREAELKSDMSGTESLIEEKLDITEHVNKLMQEEAAALNVTKTLERNLADSKSDLERLLNELNDKRSKITGTEAEKEDLEKANTISVCFNCGHELPADMIEENKAKQVKAITEKQKTIADTNKKCIALKTSVDNYTVNITKIQNELKRSQEAWTGAVNVTKLAIDNKAKRFAEIDEAIKSRATLPPEQDESWQTIVNQIEVTKKLLGKPVSEHLEAIESKRIELEQEINTLDKSLAQADRLEKDKARVDELEAREKELAQFIATIEGQLEQIAQYNADYSTAIEAAVNDKFVYVSFKMFNENLNGSLEDTCIATMNGVPYTDLSTGQSIRCGIDIINVLSGYYGVSVSLFVDHSESITLPIETAWQTIQLYAVEGIKQLEVEVLEPAKEKVA